MSRTAGKIVGAVAGAALVYFTAGAAAPWVFGAAAAAGAVYGDYMARQMRMPGDNGREPSPFTVRSSKEPVRYAVGRVSSGGLLSWVEDGENTDEIHLAIVLCEGTIKGIHEILLDKKPIAEFGSLASFALHRNRTTADPYMMSKSADWDQNVIGEGVSWVRFTFKQDAEKFPNGLPQIQVVFDGNDKILDPRDGNRKFTDNSALIALWWMTEGRESVPPDEINIESFIDAANICDEVVTNADGSASKRYTMGAVISDSEGTPDVLQKILDTCAGQLVRVGGIWHMYVGAYKGSADFTITQDMVVGAVGGTVEVDNSAAINTVTGTFINAEDWIETDFPPVKVQDWITEDGAELAESIQLRYVTNPYQAQRLAAIELRRRRNGGGLSLPLNFVGYQCRPSRVVQVDLPILNIVGQYIVTDWTMGLRDACTVELAPYDADMFDDDVTRVYTPPSPIQIPAADINTPSNLSFVASDDPLVKQGVLSWSPPPQPVEFYGITLRKNGVAVQSYQVPQTAHSVDVQGLDGGSYVFEIYAQGVNRRSGTASILVELVAPAAPTLNLTPSNTTIECRPSVLNAGFGTEYDMCVLLRGSTDAPYAQQTGLYAVFPGLSPDTEYTVYARTINPLGHSVWVSGNVKTTNNVSELPPTFIGELERELEDLEGRFPIDTVDIKDDAVTAGKIYVDRLSALTANMGILNAGTINVGGGDDYVIINDTQSYIDVGGRDGRVFRISKDGDSYINGHALGASSVMGESLSQDAIDFIIASIGAATPDTGGVRSMAFVPSTTTRTLETFNSNGSDVQLLVKYGGQTAGRILCGQGQQPSVSAPTINITVRRGATVLFSQIYYGSVTLGEVVSEYCRDIQVEMPDVAIDLTDDTPPQGDISYNIVMVVSWPSEFGSLHTRLDFRSSQNASGGGGGGASTWGQLSGKPFESLGAGLEVVSDALRVKYGTAAGTAAQGNDTRITGAAQKSANLSDLSSASAARQNLGLGTAATRNVGTAAGNVMEVGTGTRRIATSGSTGVLYARIGRVTDDTSIAFLLSGGGDHGSAQRQTIIITAGSRRGGVSATHTELTGTNTSSVRVYYVPLGNSSFDIWISKANYQRTISLHVLDSYGEIVGAPVWEGALPTNAVTVARNNYVHTGNILGTTGANIYFPMSQKATTDALSTKVNTSGNQTINGTLTVHDIILS